MMDLDYLPNKCYHRPYASFLWLQKNILSYNDSISYKREKKV